MTVLPAQNATNRELPRTLYGRDAERAALRADLDETTAGQGHLVLVSGEAGIGKTALVEDLGDCAASQGALVVTGRNYDLTELSPYSPWIEILKRYSPSDDLPPIPAGLMPGVDLSGIRSQQALFEAARDFFSAIADDRPLVIVLEDAHWADQASLEILRYLARWLTDRRVLFVVTYRDEELEQDHVLFRQLPAMVRETQATRIELRPITEQALDRLIGDRYGLADEDHRRLAEFLTEYSGGNPFFALELLRSFEIDDVLSRDETGWRFGDTSSFRMPALLRQVMGNRLASQDEDVRSWLEVAALIGMDVAFDLWAAVCQAPPERLADAYNHARNLGIVRETPGRASFEFSHALLREALYERVSLPHRIAWHTRVGDALAASPQPQPDLVAHHYGLAGDARVVEWLIRAGESAQGRYVWNAAIERYDQAIAALDGAGDRINDLGWLYYRRGTLARFRPMSESRPALERAERLGATTDDRVLVTYSRFMLNLVQSFSAQSDLPLQGLRDAVNDIGRLTPDELARAGRLRTSLFGDLTSGVRSEGTVNLGLGTLALRLASTGRHAEAEAAARQLLDAVDDRPAHGDPILVPYADAYTALAFVHTVRCQPDEAREALHLAGEAYRRADDRRAEALGYFAELTLVVNTFELQRRDERRKLAEQAAAAMQRAQGAFPSELPPELFAFENLWIEGDWDRAAAFAKQADTVMGSELILAEIALYRGLDNAYYRALDDEAWQIIKRALPDGHATAPGMPSFLVRFHLIQIAARLSIADDDLEASRAWIECSARWIEWARMTFGLADLALLWAEYHAISGDLDAARDQALRALELAAGPRQAFVLMPAHRLLAYLACQARDFELAGYHARMGIEIARDAGMPFEEALGWLVQAEISIGAGDVQAAESLLDAATGIFQQLKALPCLERVAALRSRLERADGDAPYPSGLSAREVEVLRLVAEGLTDAEVAERLFISRRTVSQHLRSIYNKLGVGSRVAAARFAIEHGLT